MMKPLVVFLLTSTMVAFCSPKDGGRWDGFLLPKGRPKTRLTLW